MSKCSTCETKDNLVYSGVDALLLGIPGAETQTKCYPCANKERNEQLEKEQTDGTI